VSARTGAPIAGLAVVGTFDLACLVAFGVAGTAPMTVFFYLATIGVLSLLAMYALANVAAARHLARREAIVPLLGLAVALYTLYRNVWPVPDWPFNAFPYLVAAWLLLGLGLARQSA
jgi:hypothetical protein